MLHDEIDLASPDSFLAGIPHSWFKRLRAEDPVHWHEQREGPGFWCITKHEDLKQVSRNPALFSSEEKSALFREMEPEGLVRVRAIMLNMDPPKHVKYRRIVQRGFTPQMVERMRVHVEALAAGIVDRIAPLGRCEFVEEVAAELPLQVICELMGVPQEDRHHLFEVSNRLIGFDDPDFQTSEEDGQLASIEIFTYANQHAARLKKNPGDDLTSLLMTAEVEGERLSELEFCSFFLLLVIAGNETTRTVTANGMHRLIQSPDQLRKLVEDPSLIDSAVEEILRYDPAVINFRRTAMDDTELRGRKIRKGDKVVVWYPSANRDEEVFADPDTFDVQRDPNPHLAFGIGEHFCLGANLARMELQCILREVVTRLRDPELAGPVLRLRSNFINGVKKMPVAWD